MFWWSIVRILVFPFIIECQMDKRWTETRLECLRQHNDRKITTTTFEDCKKMCEIETAFVCRSTDYYPKSGECDLSKSDSSSPSYMEPCYSPFHGNLYAEIIPECTDLVDNCDSNLQYCEDIIAKTYCTKTCGLCKDGPDPFATTTTTPTPTTTAPTTTTIPTTTTTAPPATITTTTATTTPENLNEYWARNCSSSVTMAHGLVVDWQSPLYDGGTTNYPKGDYCCALKVTIPASYLMFTATMVFESPSSIYETRGCKGDHIYYMSSSGDGEDAFICGDISGQSWAETQVYNGPLNFSFTWCSDSTDGGTDIGFKMTMSGIDLLVRK